MKAKYKLVLMKAKYRLVFLSTFFFDQGNLLFIHSSEVKMEKKKKLAK